MRVFLALTVFALVTASSSSSLDCANNPYGKTVPYKLLSRKICGLNNPRGVIITNDGAFVAEAGSGGNYDNPNLCRVPPESGVLNCAGASAGLVQRKDGKNSRVLTGILSVAQAAVCTPTDPGYVPQGFFATGLHGLGIRGDRVFGAVTLSAFSTDPSGFTAGKLLEFSGFNLQSAGGVGRIRDILSRRRNRAPAFRAIGDLVAFENANNPDGAQIDSNPYGVVALPNGEIWVADAAANDVLRVLADGLHVVATFPKQNTPSPVDTCNPQYEAVPTSLAYNPRDGNVYVGFLTGWPYPQAAATVQRFVRTRGAALDGSQDTFTTEVFASGFTMITGLTFDEYGNLYVLEMSHAGLGPNQACTGPPAASSCSTPGAPAFPNWCQQPVASFGAVTLVTPTGEKTVLLGVPDCSNGEASITHEPLIYPGGIAYKRGGKLYISNRSVMAGIGELVTFDVSKWQPKTYSADVDEVDEDDN